MTGNINWEKRDDLDEKTSSENYFYCILYILNNVVKVEIRIQLAIAMYYK